MVDPYQLEDFLPSQMTLPFISLIQSHICSTKPTIIFLSETMLSAQKNSLIGQRLGFLSFATSSISNCGDFGILWKDEVDRVVTLHSDNFIISYIGLDDDI